MPMPRSVISAVITSPSLKSFTLIELPSGENFMALPIMFTHTCESISALVVYCISCISMSKLMSLAVHCFSRRSMQFLICSSREKLVLSVMICWFSSFESIRMFDERLVKRLDSLMIMSMYSCFFSSERFSFFSCFAKPWIETIGVLNSWEKLLIKFSLNISMPPSSCAILL